MSRNSSLNVSIEAQRDDIKLPRVEFNVTFGILRTSNDRPANGEIKIYLYLSLAGIAEKVSLNDISYKIL